MENASWGGPGGPKAPKIVQVGVPKHQKLSNRGQGIKNGAPRGPKIVPRRIKGRPRCTQEGPSEGKFVSPQPSGEENLGKMNDFWFKVCAERLKKSRNTKVAKSLKNQGFL